MRSIEETIDISDVLPKGVSFTIGKKEYEIIYNFKTLKELGDMYGGIQNAIDALTNHENPYQIVLDFLWAALGERYKLKKTDIEEWIGPGSLNLLYNLIYTAVMKSFGNSGKEDMGE